MHRWPSGRYVFRCHPSATKIQIRRAPRRGVRRPEDHRHRRQHHQRARQEASPLARSDAGARSEPRLEEGNRDSRRRPEDRRPFRGRIAMPTKKYKPTSPGRRFMSVSSFEGVTKSAPQRQLVEHLKKHSGRNASGRITVRHQGGGHKKTYRLIDFKRQKDGRPGHGEDDRVRPEPQCAHRADRLRRRRQALHPLAARAQRRRHCQLGVMPPRSVRDARCRSPTSRWAPPSTTSRSSSAAEASWCAAPEPPRSCSPRRARYAQVRMPSGEVRLIDVRCRATIGQVGNVDHENEVVGKAGKSRHGGASARRCAA